MFYLIIIYNLNYFSTNKYLHILFNFKHLTTFMHLLNNNFMKNTGLL